MSDTSCVTDVVLVAAVSCAAAVFSTLTAVGCGCWLVFRSLYCANRLHSAAMATQCESAKKLIETAKVAPRAKKGGKKNKPKSYGNVLQLLEDDQGEDFVRILLEQKAQEMLQYYNKCDEWLVNEGSTTTGSESTDEDAEASDDEAAAAEASEAEASEAAEASETEAEEAEEAPEAEAEGAEADEAAGEACVTPTNAEKGAAEQPCLLMKA